MNRFSLSIAVLSALIASCAFAQDHEDVVAAARAVTHTPTGRAIGDSEFTPATRKRLEQDLAIAQAAMEIAPEREDSYSWLGRRYGYLGMFPEAIAVFSEGLAKFPDSYKLYRYRGRHLARNYQFEQAISDYRKAAELLKDQPDSYEPNGIPNKLDLTINTFKQNIPYYLGQTSMATGDYETVIAGMDEAINVPVLFAYNEELVPVTMWKYMAYRKMGLHAEAEAELAKVPDELDLIENDTYHQAVNYLKGLYPREEFLSTADALGKYAVAMKDHFEGDDESAKAIWEEITAASPRGYWPAEVELVNLRR